MAWVADGLPQWEDGRVMDTMGRKKVAMTHFVRRQTGTRQGRLLRAGDFAGYAASKKSVFIVLGRLF
ncbi:MAG: hypothetical protein AOY29_10215 [Alcanivorax borkumensis]|nr:MAG: hypothetical protein AOY29_10215 [Alcanivorax borkumensis]